MELKTDSSSNSGELILDGDITIENAGELKKILIESMKKTDNLIIYLDKVTAMDLSSLQLLCSAHRSFIKLNKKIKLQTKSLELFKKVVNNAGYSRVKGCIEPYDQCFWVA
ncbi:STAS domain-containing protein [Candidatus Magnetomoraceae bacterium gMMP-1]